MGPPPLVNLNRDLIILVNHPISRHNGDLSILRDHPIGRLERGSPHWLSYMET